MMARRQRRAFGCVQRIRHNVYRLRWTDAGRRFSETVYGTRADAERRMSEIHVVTDESRPAMMRVAAVYDRFVLPEYERKLSQRSLDNIASCWRKHVYPKWGSEYVDGVKASDFQEWILGIPPNSASKAMDIMRRVMRHAVMMEMIDHSQLDIRFEMPGNLSKKCDRTVIESGKIASYHAAVRGSMAEAPFILGACAGLRVGEMLGVKVGEIEYIDGIAVFEVKREVDDVGRIVVGKDGIESVKTKTSRRWAVAYDPYASRLMELQEEASARGDVYLCDDGEGNPIGKRVLRRIWDTACMAAGLHKILLRNLRPTFATSMKHAVGMQTDDIARLMGHTEPRVTYGVYERPDRSDIISSALRAVRD